ncbi:hypothetical protein [Alienimonas sp. DA493]|uniref:hypothetical protein n=1 Tax=Alienimonas sp. DA493 TaxID=3373605 RepID=UPI003754B65C
MFGLFTPRPPLEVQEQAWVERHLNVLAGRLGPERLGLNGGEPVEQLLPSRELAGFDGSAEKTAQLFARFAAHLGIDPDGVTVEWFDGDRRTDPNQLHVVGGQSRPWGLWSLGDGQTPTVSLNRELTSEPTNLAATVAHELCHQILLGESLRGERFMSLTDALEETLRPPSDREASGSPLDDPDEEPRTDLTCAALGLGLFVANATVQEQRIPATAAGTFGHWWQIGRSGYLTSRELGYALALLWHVRQERDGSTGDPPWIGELRGDAAAAVTGGLKYLRKVGDARFSAASLRDSSPPTEAGVREDLHHKRPARRLAAVWDAAQLRDRESRTPAVESETLSALLETLRDREPAVRAAAAEAIGRLCPDAATDRDAWDRCLVGLIAATDDPLAAVRAAALRGLAAAPDLARAEAAREELDRVALAGLGARTPAVRSAAAAIAVRLPPVEAESGGLSEPPFAPAVLKALVGALVRCDDREAAEHVATLRELHPDPAAFAEERVDDDELLSRVLDALGVAPLAEPEPEPMGVAQ